MRNFVVKKKKKNRMQSSLQVKLAGQVCPLNFEQIKGKGQIDRQTYIKNRRTHTFMRHAHAYTYLHRFTHTLSIKDTQSERYVHAHARVQ